MPFATIPDMLSKFGLDLTATMSMPLDEEETSHRKARGARRNSHEQQLERMTKCGTYTKRREAEGQLEPFKYICQLKICPHCGVQRGLKLKARIGSVVKSGKQVGYFIAHNESEARAIVELAQGAKNYLRIPQQDGTEFIFIGGDDIAGAVPITSEADLETLDWTAIQNTADSRNASGELGKKAVVKEKDENAFSYGTASYFVADEQQALFNTIEDDVLLATFDMDPHSKDQFVRMMSKRDRMLREQADKANISYTRITTYIRVNLSYTDWLVSIYDRCQDWLLTGKLSIARWNAFWNSLDAERQQEIVSKAHERRLSRPLLNDLT